MAKRSRSKPKVTAVYVHIWPDETPADDDDLALDRQLKDCVEMTRAKMPDAAIEIFCDIDGPIERGTLRAQFQRFMDYCVT